MLHIPRPRHGMMFSYPLVSTIRTRGTRTYIKDKVVTGDHAATSFSPAITNVLFLLLERRKYFFLFVPIIISVVLAWK